MEMLSLANHAQGFARLMALFETGQGDAILAECRQLLEEDAAWARQCTENCQTVAPSPRHERAQAWADALCAAQPLFRQAHAQWPAHKILLQVAMEHGQDSPLTLAAQQWLDESPDHGHWLRLRRHPIAAHWPRRGCLQHLEVDRFESYNTTYLGQDRLWSAMELEDSPPTEGQPRQRRSALWSLSTGQRLADFGAQARLSMMSPGLARVRLPKQPDQLLCLRTGQVLQHFEPGQELLAAEDDKRIWLQPGQGLMMARDGKPSLLRRGWGRALKYRKPLHQSVQVMAWSDALSEDRQRQLEQQAREPRDWRNDYPPSQPSGLSLPEPSCPPQGRAYAGFKHPTVPCLNWAGKTLVLLPNAYVSRFAHLTVVCRPPSDEALMHETCDPKQGLAGEDLHALQPQCVVLEGEVGVGQEVRRLLMAWCVSTGLCLGFLELPPDTFFHVEGFCLLTEGGICLVVSGYGNAYWVWNLSRQEVSKVSLQEGESIDALTLLPGQRLLLSTRLARANQTHHHALLMCAQSHTPLVRVEEAQAVLWVPGGGQRELGRLVFSRSCSTTGQSLEVVWDIALGRETLCRPQVLLQDIKKRLWIPGQGVLSAEWGPCMRLWSPESGGTLQALSVGRGHAWNLELIAPGKVLVHNDDGSVSVWALWPHRAGAVADDAAPQITEAFIPLGDSGLLALSEARHCAGQSRWQARWLAPSQAAAQPGEAEPPLPQGVSEFFCQRATLLRDALRRPHPMPTASAISQPAAQAPTLDAQPEHQPLRFEGPVWVLSQAPASEGREGALQQHLWWQGRLHPLQTPSSPMQGEEAPLMLAEENLLIGLSTNSLVLWRLSTGALVDEQPLQRPCEGVRCLGDGLVASWGAHHVQVWQVAPLQSLHVFEWGEAKLQDPQTRLSSLGQGLLAVELVGESGGGERAEFERLPWPGREMAAEGWMFNAKEPARHLRLLDVKQRRCLAQFNLPNRARQVGLELAPADAGKPQSPRSPQTAQRLLCTVRLPASDQAAPGLEALGQMVLWDLPRLTPLWAQTLRASGPNPGPLRQAQFAGPERIFTATLLGHWAWYCARSGRLLTSAHTGRALPPTEQDFEPLSPYRYFLRRSMVTQVHQLGSGRYTSTTGSYCWGSSHVATHSHMLVSSMAWPLEAPGAGPVSTSGVALPGALGGASTSGLLRHWSGRSQDPIDYLELDTHPQPVTQAHWLQLAEHMPHSRLRASGNWQAHALETGVRLLHTPSLGIAQWVSAQPYELMHLSPQGQLTVILKVWHGADGALLQCWFGNRRLGFAGGEGLRQSSVENGESCVSVHVDPLEITHTVFPA
jgi:hypothetical protein